MTPSSMVAAEPVADASVANVVADATLVAYPVAVSYTHLTLPTT